MLVFGNSLSIRRQRGWNSKQNCSWNAHRQHYGAATKRGFRYTSFYSNIRNQSAHISTLFLLLLFIKRQLLPFSANFQVDPRGVHV